MTASKVLYNSEILFDQWQVYYPFFVCMPPAVEKGYVLVVEAYRSCKMGDFS